VIVIIPKGGPVAIGSDHGPGWLSSPFGVPCISITGSSQNYIWALKNYSIFHIGIIAHMMMMMMMMMMRR
jgi:hypothetical protein